MPLEARIAELVREQALRLMKEEVPHSVTAEVVEIDEHRVHVRVYTETESQKQILIGKGGSMVREIGRWARPGIEELLGHTIYLELQVKASPEVAPERDDARAARALRLAGDCLFPNRHTASTSRSALTCGCGSSPGMGGRGPWQVLSQGSHLTSDGSTRPQPCARGSRLDRDPLGETVRRRVARRAMHLDRPGSVRARRRLDHRPSPSSRCVELAIVDSPRGRSFSDTRGLRSRRGRRPSPRTRCRRVRAHLLEEDRVPVRPAG